MGFVGASWGVGEGSSWGGDGGGERGFMESVVLWMWEKRDRFLLQALHFVGDKEQLWSDV